MKSRKLLSIIVAVNIVIWGGIVYSGVFACRREHVTEYEQQIARLEKRITELSEIMKNHNIAAEAQDSEEQRGL